MAAQANRFTFGNNNGNVASVAQGGPNGQRKAEYWLNVGYPTGHEKLDFVSLPMGIPMDASDKKELRGDPNSEMVQFLGAGNDLFDDIMEVAGDLEPGEAKIIEIPLQIQVRRIKGGAEPVAREQNMFARPALAPTAPTAPAQPAQPVAE